MYTQNLKIYWTDSTNAKVNDDHRVKSKLIWNTVRSYRTLNYNNSNSKGKGINIYIVLCIRQKVQEGLINLI